jgi:peroxiredoxin
MFTPGDPVPWFVARSTVNPEFHFDTVAGRYIVLCFFGSAADPAARRLLDAVQQNEGRFDGAHAAFFGVSTDPEDESLGRIRQEHPGLVYFWDFDRSISRLYGAAPADGTDGPYQPRTFILNKDLRTIAAVSIDEDPEAHVTRILAMLGALPPAPNVAGHAPVLIVPWVFEQEVCRHLIGLYEKHGGQESGFMRDVDGKTVGVTDHGHKRRRDCPLTDPDLIFALELRLVRRLVPEIRKAFQFDATHIERHIVACYDAAEGGHFRAHRDNTTRGTAHRRFAVTINLNAEEYEGGNLRFPEFGRAQYRAPTGGAVVFGCSLLHEASPVTKGKRYAYLPFLYDAAAAKIREENLAFLESNPTSGG